MTAIVGLASVIALPGDGGIFRLGENKLSSVPRTSYKLVINIDEEFMMGMVAEKKIISNRKINVPVYDEVRIITLEEKESALMLTLDFKKQKQTYYLVGERGRVEKVADEIEINDGLDVKIPRLKEGYLIRKVEGKGPTLSDTVYCRRIEIDKCKFDVFYWTPDTGYRMKKVE